VVVVVTPQPWALACTGTKLMNLYHVVVSGLTLYFGPCALNWRLIVGIPAVVSSLRRVFIQQGLQPCWVGLTFSKKDPVGKGWVYGTWTSDF